MNESDLPAAQATRSKPSPFEPEADVSAIGMWIFVASEILFFTGLFFAYAYARATWPHGFALASRHTDVVLGTLNTAVLLTSSALAALAVRCAGYEPHRHRVARLLRWVAALGLAFLVVKGIEYRHEWNDGLFPNARFALADVAGARMFFLLYFVMTGLHAAHMLFGVAAMAVFAYGAERRRAWADEQRVEASALYWHFVDAVWIALYPLLYLVERHA